MNHKYFLEKAKHQTNWSEDPSTKVGCVITHSYQIVSAGHNSFPNNCDSSKLTYDKPLKYRVIMHAEEMALHNWYSEDKYSPNLNVLYCTDAPCENCLKQIINSGISQVYYSSPRLMRDKGSDEVKQAIRMLIEASGIVVKNGENDKNYLDELGV